MSRSEPKPQPGLTPLTETTVELRVRYVECDPMGLAHHTAYPVWLELARTELLRRQGVAYRDLEAERIYFVVARMNLRYRRPARYDDVLGVTVAVSRANQAKIEHSYAIRRGDELLATAETTLVCVDAAGRIQPVPEHLPGICSDG